jgi:hypothetical protein
MIRETPHFSQAGSIDEALTNPQVPTKEKEMKETRVCVPANALKFTNSSRIRKGTDERATAIAQLKTQCH